MFGFLQLNCRTALRRTLLLMALSMAVIAGYAQDYSKMSISTQMFLDRINGKIDTDDGPQRARARQLGLHPVNENAKFDQFVADPDTINGKVYMSAFVRIDDASAISELEALGVIVQEQFLDGKLVTTLIPIDKIEAVSSIAKVNRVNAATMMRTSTNTARQKTNVDDVLTYSADAQSAGLPSAFDGSGVVLGVIDTGIDFNHIAFKDASGNSRIKQAYVYNGSSASTYTGSQITSNLTDDKSEDHGTHTSSTAGGSSVTVSGTTVTVTDNHANATYGGMAPGADLYLAGIKNLNDTYLTNAVNNMCTYANNQGKPLVVSNSWGSQIGPHDGTGDVADIYNSLFGDNHPNRVALFAASNDGGKSPASEAGGFHVRGTTSSSNPLGSILRCHYYSDTDNGFMYNGVVTNAWFRSTVSNVTVKVLVLNSNTGAKLAETTVTPTSSGASVSGLSTYYSGSLYAYKDYVSANGKTQVMLYGNSLQSRSYDSNYNSNYTLAIQIYPNSGSAVLDMWGGNTGYFTSHLTTSGYTWTNGSDDMCVSDESMIANVISVGAYATKNGGMNTSYTIGDIADFSSWATASASPDGNQYPWITAPGARLIAGVNHNHTTSVDNYSYYGSNYNSDLVVNSSTNPYAYMEGTSMATPTAAGIVALWMQASKDENAKDEWKNLTVNKVKQLMAQTAIHDSYTNGTNASHFGNGKIDALAGIAEILETNGPKITATPTSLAFGDKVAGTTNNTMTFTVTGSNLEGNISLSSSNSSIFSVSPTSVSKATAEGNGATITVTFKPTANVTQNYTGTITLTSSNATNVTVSLSGRGVYTAPSITASPTSVAFGTSNYTSQTYTKTVTVTGSNLQGNISAAISGTNAAMFSVSPTTIANNNGSASGTVTITYSPTAAGSHSANLVLTTTGTGANTVTVPITGTANGPSITANPTSLNFTGTYAGETATKTFTVKGVNLSGAITATLNNGGGIYSIDKTSITKAQAEASGGATITVTYAPTAVGQSNASVTLSSTGCNPVTVSLSGTALGPNISASPENVAFTGYTGQTYTKTVTVTGNHLSANVTAALTGANGIYSIDKTSLGTSGGTITLTYAPTERGNSNATLTLSSANVDDVVIPITGVANGGTITATPTTASFSGYATRTYTQAVTIGSSNLEQDITVTLNDANGIYSIDKTSITKNTNGNTLTVTWAPTTAVQTNASITLSSRNADDVTINLTGTAQAATPTLVVTPANLSFSADLGATDSKTFAVTGRFISDDVTLTLSDANGVFALGQTTIPASSISETNAVNITVNFMSNDEGDFTGTVTVASNGAESTTVNLTGSVSTGGTASDAYLNIAKYATIDEAGATVSNMSSIYKYSEYDDDACAWLTLSTYGAMKADANQNWLTTTSLSQYTNTWSAQDIFLGNGSYFTSSGYSIYGSGYQTFYVTNCTQVRALIKGGSANATLAIYECNVDENGTPTASTTATDTQTGNCSSSSPAVITSATIDASKVYMVRLTGGGSYPDLCEIGFQTPIHVIGQPEIVNVEPAATTADVTWIAGEDNETWNLRYRPYVEDPNHYWDFEDESQLGEFTLVDADSDGFNWEYHNNTGLAQGIMAAHEGNGLIISESYDNDTRTALSPNNWLISPVVDLNGVLKFYAAGQDANYASEKFGVYVCTGNSTNPSDFVQVGADKTSTSEYVLYEFDLTAYEGQGRFAIVHHNVSDMFILKVDDISLTYPDFVSPEWIYANNLNDTEYTITGLTPETTYEVQVQGVSGNKTTKWTASTLFTTLAEEIESITLAELVATGVSGQNYNVEDGNLICVKVLDVESGALLLCKDNNLLAESNRDVNSSNAIDYMGRIGNEIINERIGITDDNVKGENYDQSNWVVLYLPSSVGAITETFEGYTLSGVKGVYTDIANHTIELTAKPETTEESDYALNVFIPAAFRGTQTSDVHNNNYFFVQPEPMEVAWITWAVWDGDKFVMPAKDQNGNNQANLQGQFFVNCSLMETNGAFNLNSLNTGVAYSFIALMKKENASGSVGKNSAPRRADGDGGLVAYAISVPQSMGDVVTGINSIDVNAANVKSVTYYNVHGQASMQAFDGVNIVEVRYTDGSRKVVKIFK